MGGSFKQGPWGTGPRQTLVCPPMILELIVSGSLATYRPTPPSLPNIKPSIITEQIEPLEPLEAPQLEKLEPAVKVPTAVQKTASAPRRASQSRVPAGWFPYGQCTYWVWSKRSVGFWNDATDWKWQAQRDGWTVSSRPVVGAIAWQYGHVAYVESIGSGTVTISEMNYKGLGVVSRRTVPTATFSYIY